MSSDRDTKVTPIAPSDLTLSTTQEIDEVYARLSKTFESGVTRPLAYRRTQLLQLARMLQDNHTSFEDALLADLNKPRMETTVAEVAHLVTSALNAAENLEEWAAPTPCPTKEMWRSAWGATLHKEPKGVALIISPWNYPLVLTVNPLIGAIAAGCPVVLKPSELVPTFCELVSRLVSQYLDPAAYAVVKGAVPETTHALALRWAHIFYTGNSRVGRIVATAAGRHLTPVTLELGGKSPVVLAEDIGEAEMDVVARRVWFGKMQNAGQLCIAPDYAVVPRAKVDRFVEGLKKAHGEFFPDGEKGHPLTGEIPLSNIINPTHHARLVDLLRRTKGRVVFGGEIREDKSIGPTILTDVPVDDVLMEEEIFGPFLPIIPVDSIDEAIQVLNSKPSPLVIYLFTNQDDLKYKFLERTKSGQLVLNDTIMQLVAHEMPFGGQGESGYGMWFGKATFDLFTHSRGSITVPFSEEQFFEGSMQNLNISVARPQGLPDLNFDILSQITSSLTRCDVARLSRTCRTLRSALSPELPRGGVTLEARSLTSFLQFADTKHGEDRLRYFHELVLPGSTYTYKSLLRSKHATSIKNIGHAVSTVLLAAHDLEYLSILDLNVFSFPPAMLKEVLSSLPHLRELEMSAVQKIHENALEKLLPRLRKLGLRFQDGCNASTFLQLDSAAPQALELAEVVLYNATFQTASPSFPAVCTLRVSPVMVPSDIDALTRLFPNVEDVVFDFHHTYVDSGYGGRDQSWTDPSAKTWRDRLLSRPQKKADAWPHIKSLRITGQGVQNVVWAGLTCQVPRLEVGCQILKVQGLVGVLGELCSDCVVFRPGVFHAPWRMQSVGWDLLRAIESARCVTRLAIVLCRGVVDPVRHVLRWAEEAFGTCSVSCLLLRFEFDYPTSEERSSQLERLRAALSGKILSLRVVLFQMKDDVLLCWKKEERARGAWKKMSEDEGRKLIASEKMCPASIEPCEQCKNIYSGNDSDSDSDQFCYE
ncbi:hypothetical protein GSI_10957 [Ganoderma sinense ZZ0214-1]|uniref:Aldehyde dehydrogenase domain-containing protein n=1 Tax=Ganoderma sinense ZZ0214-1 TaxID=1077348 RepID=A0A2G8S202_9APHY|nr:hypothetical protein GSI_10957 [Ganoderma sinense ZZ0214-1]